MKATNYDKMQLGEIIAFSVIPYLALFVKFRVIWSGYLQQLWGIMCVICRTLNEFVAKTGAIIPPRHDNNPASIGFTWSWAISGGYGGEVSCANMSEMGD